MNEKIKLVNPTFLLAKHEKTCTSIDIPNSHRGFLMSLFPQTGVVQNTMNILLSRFVETLKHEGFTEYDPARYKAALENVTMELGKVVVVTSSKPFDTPILTPEAEALVGRKKGDK